MSFNLSGLDKFVSGKRKFKPSNLDSIHYLFFEKGLDFNSFNELPIPYIVNIINTHIYMKEQEERAYKKANKK